MPFKSEAQRKYLFSQHPEIARRWAKEYGTKVVRKAAPKPPAKKR